MAFRPWASPAPAAMILPCRNSTFPSSPGSPPRIQSTPVPNQKEATSAGPELLDEGLALLRVLDEQHAGHGGRGWGGEQLLQARLVGYLHNVRLLQSGEKLFTPSRDIARTDDTTARYF